MGTVTVLGTPPVLDLIAQRAARGGTLENLCLAEDEDDYEDRGRRLARLGLLPRADAKNLTAVGRRAAARLKKLLDSGASLYVRPTDDGGSGGGLDVEVA